MASSEGGKLTVSSNIRTDYSSQTPKSYNPQHKSMSTLWITYMFLLFFPPHLFELSRSQARSSFT